jgi:glycosyltransferase involved in cell wall biosynthesis
MPAYNRPDTLSRTLESLLAQTFGDLAVLIVDDAPSPAVRSIVNAYAHGDPRITYEENPARLGMIGNWRRAFERSQQLFPNSPYFAWVSDHDIWHPRWLEVLVSVLEGQPAAVAAYPRTIRVYRDRRRRTPSPIETAGVTVPRERLRRTAGMTAGNCIYGLFRARALAQAGVFRPVLMPDRQVLVQLSLLGEFRAVPELLWYREVADGGFSYARQRRMFFPGRAPWFTYLPAVIQHNAVLIWDGVALGRGRPVFGRVAAMRYAWLHLWYSARRQLSRRDAAWRRVVTSTVPGRWLIARTSAVAARQTVATGTHGR